MVGTEAAHELYSEAVREWFELPADVPTPPPMTVAR
jgi:hypothetical protein